MVSDGSPPPFSSVPTMVALVNVTERSVTSVTLQWNVDVEKNWNYTLQINGETFQVPQNGSLNVVSQSSQSLQPGTEYAFSVTTVFSGLKSTPYKGFIVTGKYTCLLSDKLKICCDMNNTVLFYV